jgi:hypothetical protein
VALHFMNSYVAHCLLSPCFGSFIYWLGPNALGIFSMCLEIYLYICTPCFFLLVFFFRHVLHLLEINLCTCTPCFWGCSPCFWRFIYLLVPHVFGDVLHVFWDFFIYLYPMFLEIFSMFLEIYLSACIYKCFPFISPSTMKPEINNSLCIKFTA